MYFSGKVKWDSDEKSAGCGILMKKERERGINTPFQTSLRVAVPSPRGKTGGKECLRKAGTNRVM